MKKYYALIITLFLSINFWANDFTRPFQFSFITPLGTNGMQSSLYTNSFSINILGGASSANTVFELGGLYNMNLEYTQGFQLSGLFNYTGEAKKAFQLAGVANFSVAGDSSGQIAGVGNLAQNVVGFQGSGIINLAEDVKGVQLSGFMNYATSVKGLQTSPIYNVAENVKGVQLGLVNYADSIDGVQLGLINIVKTGGKKEVELSFGETLDTVISFKLGTDVLYTIFSAGVAYSWTEWETAGGLGLGTQLNWGKGWANQIEIMAYQLTDETLFTTPLNMLTQLKLLASKQIFGGLSFIAGPTANLSITQLKDDTGNFIDSISPWTLLENNSESTRLRFWVGFSAGLTYRFK